MPALTFYIIYHKIVYEENTKDFSDTLKNSTLFWVAVNEQIEKEYPPWIHQRLLKEWEMPHYSPLYQMSNWYQNSFFHHLYKNHQSIPTKYVGFAQYDQSLNATKFENLIQQLQHDKADKVIGCFPYEFQTILDIFNEEEWKQMFIVPYNAFYKLSHSLVELKDKPMFLFHTFIIPTWYFNHMMPFIEHVTPLILRHLKWNTRHLAGTLERVYALCLAAGILEGKFKSVFMFDGVQNCSTQRTPDALRGLN
jgi:hypothetical protein